MKLFYAAVLLFTFPGRAFALRKSLHGLIFGVGETMSVCMRLALTVCVVVVAGVTGIFVKSPGVAFGLTGALAGANIMYVFPSSFFLYLRLKRGMPQEFKGDIACGCVIFLTGIAVMVGGTVGLLG